ncbi:wall-associated receptor kinase-like 1 [Magnolia sinica]|uniref:wall-associated receptor kinase-like 1 n=1 Tax=Magnolia sinica TaxID=86752 RepID=UPI00265AFF4D|nr:wall-associated receptor kinase-like 1 [Magnolia sinica]
MYLVNGARLLQDLISSCDGKVNPIRIFSAEELKKATNNYDEGRILTREGKFISYKGTYHDCPIVAKKLVIVPHDENTCKRFLDRIFNEIIILSQINHRNVVRLLGCCIETASPVLVYEFISNKSLAYHIRETTISTRISWEIRIRIAIEIADAVTYLHTATPKTIVHRGVKASSILLDENYISKLSDFELAIAIPIGETHVKPGFASKLGHIDPEYLRTGQLTEKHDVFSFGVLLLELLTGQRAFDLRRSHVDEDVLLVDFVASSLNEKRLNLVLDPSIFEEGKMGQFEACAEFAIALIKEKAEERPTMKEVAQELRRIQKRELSP